MTILGKAATMVIVDDFVEALTGEPLKPYQKELLRRMEHPDPRVRNGIPYKAVHCRNCGTPYLPRRIDQVHCGKACNSEATNRDMLRGRRLLAYAYNWRKARGKGKKEDFAALCRELDAMIREDREAGRKGPKGYDPLRGE